MLSNYFQVIQGQDFGIRKIAKEIKPSQYIKFKFIQQEAGKGNPLAKQYLEKLRNEEASIDWAYRVITNTIRAKNVKDDGNSSY